MLLRGAMGSVVCWIGIVEFMGLACVATRHLLLCVSLPLSSSLSVVLLVSCCTGCRRCHAVVYFSARFPKLTPTPKHAYPHRPSTKHFATARGSHTSKSSTWLRR